MAMTNAERQARYHQRRQERLSAAISPDDVRRAVQLEWAEYAGDPVNRETRTWDQWLAHCRTKKGAREWGQHVPSSADPDDYSATYFTVRTDDDIALLAKVGAVAAAMSAPPSSDE